MVPVIVTRDASAALDYIYDPVRKAAGIRNDNAYSKPQHKCPFLLLLSGWQPTRQYC